MKSQKAPICSGQPDLFNRYAIWGNVGRLSEDLRAEDHALITDEDTLR
jgi:hypothetical protein